MACRWLAVLALLLPRPAPAQTVGTFDQLGQQLNAGDVVRVINWSGRVVVGRVAALSADALALDRDGGAKEVLKRSEVREVSHRRRDPLRNGVLIGFAAAAGSFCAVAIGAGAARACGVPAVLLGGLGAPIGALVDAAIKRRLVVFRADARPVAVAVWPVRAGVGAGASIRW